jgi:hypothetical protein
MCMPCAPLSPVPGHLFSGISTTSNGSHCVRNRPVCDGARCALVLSSMLPELLG